MKKIIFAIIALLLIFIGYNILTVEICVDREPLFSGDDGCYRIWEDSKTGRPYFFSNL